MVTRNITVKVTPEPDFGGAAQSIRDEAERMERIASETADEIEAEFQDITARITLDQASLADMQSQLRRGLDEETDVPIGVDEADAIRGFDAFRRRVAEREIELDVDESQLEQAFALADRLAAEVNDIDINTDTAELRELSKLASSLSSFTGRLGLDVEGREDLREALGLAEQLDRIREVRVAVRGRDDLERASRAADDLERTRTVPIDARAEDLIALDSQLADAGSSGGRLFADGISNAVGNINLDSVGSSLFSNVGAFAAAAGPIAAAAATAASLFGDEFTAGLDRGFNRDRNIGLQALRFGLETGEVEAIAAEAGFVYAQGFGDSAGDVLSTALLIDAEIAPLDRTLNLSRATAEAEAFAEVYGVEIPEQLELTQRLIANDLVDSHDQALDIMVDAAQRYPLSFRENFEVIDEFSSVLGKLGVDAAQVFEIAGQASREGLFPNADRTLELFEEFNIEVAAAGRAVEPIERLGLSFQEVQDQIARGDGAAALADVADALLDIEDAALRDQLAVEIFGTSIESASDPERVLELLATADAIRDVTDASGENARAREESRTGFQRLGRDVEALGGFIGTGLNREIEVLYSLFSNDGPVDLMRELGSATSDTASQLGSLVGIGNDEFQVTDDLIAAATRTVEDFGEESEDAADGVSGLASEVIDLDAALEEFAGRFDADRVFRSIEDDARALVSSFEELEDGSYTLADGFDVTTEAGSRAEATAERLSENLDDLVGLYRDNAITAEEFAAGHDRIRDALADAGREAGQTDSQVAGLVEEYGSLPTDIEIELRALDNASGVIQNAVNGLAGFRSTTITLSAGFGGSASGVFRRAATGDVADSPRVRLIGEYPGAISDPELVAPRSQLEDAVRTVLREERSATPASRGDLNVDLRGSVIQGDLGAMQRQLEFAATLAGVA